jgi:hypothetical protein
MSTEIVTDICPPSEWNLMAEDIHEMVEALEEYNQIIGTAFERTNILPGILSIC